MLSLLSVFIRRLNSPFDLTSFRFWPVIDDAIRAAAVNHRVSVKLLISYWNHSRPAEDHFLHSLEVLTGSYHNVDIQVVRRR